MPTSLFVEHHANGCAFYINGALQFDTLDEAIYHEYLVLPAIALAVRRFPQTQLRVLICGGGDGLAAREALRFAEVAEVILVDYDPAVLELGRTAFQSYNQGSLIEDDHADLGAGRVTVHTQEALRFVSALPDHCVHVVICDFTCPTCAEETQIYSSEWFAQVQRILIANGVMATNAVSPDHTTEAFWCIYQTIFAAGLQPKPMQLPIPSFQRHGYGNWGFFLASEKPIERFELENLDLPPCLRALELGFWQVFVFPMAIAQVRHQVNLHTLASPQLLYYLLNPGKRYLDPIDLDYSVDFLELQETGTSQISNENLLQLNSLAQRWLEHQHHPDQIIANAEQLFPVQHHYHNSRMVQEWSGYLHFLLEEIDSRQLVQHLLKRSQALPPKVVGDLKQFAEKVSKNQPITYVSDHLNELITILAVTLLMANLAAPDAVFAKGYYSSSRGSGEFRFGWIGFWMMILGGVWLWGLNRDSER